MKSLKEYLVPTITLFVICLVATALLGLTNQVTAPIIEQLNAEKTQKAIEAVLPGGGDSVDFTDATGLVSVVYKGESGYAVQVAPAGFDGPITMMVGVDFEGKVLGIDIINTISGAYGVRVPLFVDNAESVTNLEHCHSQRIRLVVSENDKELRVNYENS